MPTTVQHAFYEAYANRLLVMSRTESIRFLSRHGPSSSLQEIQNVSISNFLRETNVTHGSPLQRRIRTPSNIAYECVEIFVPVSENMILMFVSWRRGDGRAARVYPAKASVGSGASGIDACGIDLRICWTPF